jgi:uncharacterized protein
MIKRYAHWVVAHPWAVILASLVVVSLFGLGARHLQFTTDYRAYFSPSNPQLQSFEAMQATYSKSDNALLVITAKNGSIFTPENLQSIIEITEAAWQTPYANRVDSLSNFQYTRAQQDDLAVADFIKNPASLSPQALATLQQEAQAEPLMHKRLINAKGDVTAINITVQLPNKSMTESPEVARFVRGLAEQAEAKNPQLEVRITGVVMMNNAFGEASETDMSTLVPLMLLVVIVITGLMLKSPAPIFITFLTIVLSIVVGMGALGWTGIQMTTPVAVAPTIILTLAVADSVHLLAAFMKNLHKGQSKQEAMVASLVSNFKPVFLTSLTTLVGFLGMNFTEVPPLAHLGNVVALGVVAAFLLSISFLPALAVLLPAKARSKGDAQPRYLQWLAEWVLVRPKQIVASASLVLVLALFALPQNEINDEFVKYFGESFTFRTDTDYASEHLLGPYTIELSVGTQHTNGIADPSFLTTLDQFAQFAKTLPEVSHVNTLSDTFKRLNKNLHADDAAHYQIPANSAMASQYLLMYEMSLPYGLDLNNQMDVAKSATKITVNTANLSSSQLLDLEAQFAQWFATQAPQLLINQASTSLIFSHIGQRNAQSQLIGGPLALMIVSLMLILAFKSLRIGLISLVPNLLPAGIAFGIWALLDGQVGLSTSVVASMTLGIVVDDTIHFLNKYLYARRQLQHSAEQAIRWTFEQVGQALVITTLVLVAGFSVLMLSGFKLNADMGFLVALTLALALVLDLLLLPALLLIFDKKPYTQLSGNSHAPSAATVSEPSAV